TDSPAISNRVATMREKTSASCNISQRNRAATRETTKKASQRVLSIRHNKEHEPKRKSRMSVKVRRDAVFRSPQAPLYCAVVFLVCGSCRPEQWFFLEHEVMNWSAWRRRWLTEPLYRRMRNGALPLTTFQRQVLSSGDVWWEAQLLSGRPD